MKRRRRLHVVCAIKPPRHPASAFGQQARDFLMAVSSLHTFMFLSLKVLRVRLLLNKKQFVSCRPEVLEKDTLPSLEEQN